MQSIIDDIRSAYKATFGEDYTGDLSKYGAENPMTVISELPWIVQSLHDDKDKVVGSHFIRDLMSSVKCKAFWAGYPYEWDPEMVFVPHSKTASLITTYAEDLKQEIGPNYLNRVEDPDYKHLVIVSEKQLAKLCDNDMLFKGLVYRDSTGRNITPIMVLDNAEERFVPACDHCTKARVGAVVSSICCHGNWHERYTADDPHTIFDTVYMMYKLRTDKYTATTFPDFLDIIQESKLCYYDLLKMETLMRICDRMW